MRTTTTGTTRSSDQTSSLTSRIQGEYEATVDLVKTITDRNSLIDDGWLAESLGRRNPYVDPLNLLQIRLLNSDNRSEFEDRTLRLTVKGIAAGMKNTG